MTRDGLIVTAIGNAIVEVWTGPRNRGAEHNRPRARET